MTLAELMTKYEERVRAAAAVGSTASVADVYRDVIKELSFVDGIETAGRWMTTGEVAVVRSVSTKTIRKWCTEGRFPNAHKTSGEKGDWRIPAHEVYKDAGGSSDRVTTVPKLWRPNDG